MTVTMKNWAWSMCLKCLCVLREDWIWEDIDTSKPNEKGDMVWSGTHTWSYVEEFRASWDELENRLRGNVMIQTDFTLISLFYFSFYFSLNLEILQNFHHCLPIIDCADCHCSKNEAYSCSLYHHEKYCLTLLKSIIVSKINAGMQRLESFLDWGRSKPQKCLSSLQLLGIMGRANCYFVYLWGNGQICVKKKWKILLFL